MRQGYYNYDEKIYNPKKLKHNRQYLFVKCKNEYLLNLIENVNFTELASRNTTVFGFSNSDLVSQIYEMHINRILKF